MVEDIRPSSYDGSLSTISVCFSIHTLLSTLFTHIKSASPAQWSRSNAHPQLRLREKIHLSAAMKRISIDLCIANLRCMSTRLRMREITYQDSWRLLNG